MIEIESEKTIGELLVAKGIVGATTTLHIGKPVAATESTEVGPKMVIDPSRAKIESGVTMPEAKHFKKGSSWLPLLNKMAIGDSVFFAGATLTQLGYVRAIAKKNKTSVSMRARDNGVRMWRVPEDKPLQTEPPKLSIVPTASDDDGLGA